MRRAIATVSMSGMLRDKLRAIAAARFDAIELFEPDFINFAGSAAELREIASDLGLAIDLLQPLRDFEGMPDAQFRRNLDRAERKFDLMQALGAPLLLVCSNTSPLAIDDAERSAAQLRELAERAARRNLRIGYEALAWGRWVERYGQAWHIVERAAHPHLGLVLDSFHTLSLGDDPQPIAAIPGERIFFVQMADAPLLAMDVVQWARHHRNFPGQGQFEVEHFFEQVLRSGYTGTLSLEIFNDRFRETPNRRTAVDAMRSLLFLESRVRTRLEASADAGALAALARNELFDPPDAPALGGYAFIEFAADAETATALGALFEQLGFAPAGRHRSKAVTRYRQGGIEFVVNAEPDSPARLRFDQQGPSVCAIGLACEDPLRAAGRAAALLSARHESARGPAEQRLPAIVAPGGIIVHFVAAGGNALDPDFDAAPAGAAGAGLTTIDHLALGLAPDRFDTWVLFCRAVLGLGAGESLELADPYGLIRSCAMADAERRLRLVLNVSLSQRTRIARQVQASGGADAGVQHIALGCDDIVDTVTRLRAAGARFVPISANYYDDLLAREDVDEARVRRWQSLDILFDRGRGGDFLHAYTEPFADRFFFEVVQRGGNDGYGAANAPARLAAQAMPR